MANGIRVLRISNDLRQDDLAALTGIRQQRLSIIETGRGRPITPKEVNLIDEAFDYVASLEKES